MGVIMWKSKWVRDLVNICAEAQIQGDQDTAACAQALASAIEGNYVNVIHDRFVPYVRDREMKSYDA